MNKTIFAVLVIAATVTGLPSKVEAQSSISSQQQYTLSGDSLNGINNRTAENDFTIFFDQTQNLAGTTDNNTDKNALVPNQGLRQEINNPVQLRRVLKPQSQTTTPELTLEPGQFNVNGNDGLQLRVDVSDR
ncbi:MAG: hypothetical protein C6Y22_02660 [Hapalosiphonaceae cyanobacterium JJU2]|nr:MAG: hypothetical protein C6Y22_02660 [Hapalosiphonaceae cyanobacterium JJU2]